MTAASFKPLYICDEENVSFFSARCSCRYLIMGCNMAGTTKNPLQSESPTQTQKLRLTNAQS